MSTPQLRVIWICGAAGAGKSVAAWSLFEELAAAGRQVAYVDIDQLGMLYPASDEDSRRHVLKAAALDALVPGYVAAGAQVLVVSGVVDVRVGPTLASNVDLTVCLLAPAPAVLRERILARGWRAADAEAAVAESQLLRDAEFAEVTIDSTGLSVADTVARLRPLVAEESRAREPTGSMPESVADLDVIMVTGPRAVGSSTVAFGLAMRRWRANRKTGFVDLQQLGFMSRAGRAVTDLDLSLAQVAAMHRLMAPRDAELLVVSGQLPIWGRAALRTTLRAAPIVVVRLRADEATLRDHVRARARGSGPRLAGDDLLGADHRHQELMVASAVAEQAALDAASLHDIVLETNGRTPEELIAEVESRSNY